MHVWKNETMQMNNEREREIKNEREKVSRFGLREKERKIEFLSPRTPPPPTTSAGRAASSLLS